MTRVLLLGLLLAIAGCSSMLVGGHAGGTGNSLGADDRSAAQVSADDAITATIQSRFAADSALRAAELMVDTRDYKVTLSGTVGAFSDRDRAVRIARNTDDVRAVNNQISVNTRR